MKATISEILLTEEAIRNRVLELGRQLDRDYDGPIKMICVLKGAVPFLADLMRAVTKPVFIDFLAVSSYGQSSESSGVVRLTKDLDESIEGEDVLIVEDIIDTGLTLQYLRQNMLARKPKSLKVAVLLDKVERRRVDVPVDYVGFTVPDRFLVGYGLDYAGHFRNLPYVAAIDLEEETHGES
ncbi:MAG: hypoxanthine phosphoribosyltransferase [Clostridiales bacterium]|nr:hypoxanthine phosphoribosyltransferase [Clostridiales bacterium]